MGRVLLIDDDIAFASAVTMHLTDGGCHAAYETRLRTAADCAVEFQPDAVIINLAARDPATKPIDVFKEIAARVPDAVFLVLAGPTDVDPATEALRLGAYGSLQKPVSVREVQAAIDVVLRRRSLRTDVKHASPSAHALCRWRDAIVAFVSAQDDARNLTEFGRSIGVSCGAFRNWCRTAGLSPRRSLLFARALRAILHQRDSPTSPQNLLNIVDLRTVAKFVATSGGVRGQLPSNVDDFLRLQRFIQNEHAVHNIRMALLTRGVLQRFKRPVVRDFQERAHGR